MRVLHGIDPFTKDEVYIARNLRDRKMQRALMQFFKPENFFTGREALIQAGRHDLIGSGCDCLIPALLLRDAIELPTERLRATMTTTTRGRTQQMARSRERGLNKGYRPGRKSQKRQKKKGRGGDRP